MTRLLTLALSAVLFVLTQQPVQSQNFSDSTLTLKQLLQDYAVPDAPAFTILQETPSTILRPSSVRMLAVAVSDFLGTDAQVTLPSTFALEVSPGLLIAGNDLTLAEYRDAPWLYRMRISVGTKRENSQTGATGLAVGLRIPLIDKADLRTNDAVIDQVNSYAMQIVNIRKNTGNPLQGGGEPTPAQQTSIDSLRNLINTTLANPADAQDSLWNRMAFDLAFALGASSPDSLGKNLQLDNISAWATFAWPLGSWGQVFIAGHYQNSRMLPATEYTSKFNGAARFYIGTNFVKTYVEAQASIADMANALLLTGGAEVRLYDGLWLEFNAGADVTEVNNATNLVSSFRVKFGT